MIGRTLAVLTILSIGLVDLRSLFGILDIDMPEYWLQGSPMNGTNFTLVRGRKFLFYGKNGFMDNSIEEHVPFNVSQATYQMLFSAAKNLSGNDLVVEKKCNKGFLFEATTFLNSGDSFFYCNKTNKQPTCFDHSS